MFAFTASQYPLLLGKFLPSARKIMFSRHFINTTEGQPVLRLADKYLQGKSFVPRTKLIIHPERRTIFGSELLKFSLLSRSTQSTTISVLKRYMSSQFPENKESLQPNKNETRENPLNVESWQRNSSKQSIFGALVSIFKLILSLAIDFVLVLFKLLRSLFGDKGKKILEGAAKTGAGAEIKRGVEKSKEYAERELPKINEKLEKSIPIAKQNLQNFGHRLNEELQRSKTGEEKFDRIMQNVGDLTKKNRVFQIFIAFLIIMFAYQVLRFLFWFLFGGSRKKSAKNVM